MLYLSLLFVLFQKNLFNFTFEVFFLLQGTQETEIELRNETDILRNVISKSTIKDEPLKLLGGISNYTNLKLSI